VFSYESSPEQKTEEWQKTSFELSPSSFQEQGKGIVDFVSLAQPFFTKCYA
jgi:hypothetical protein